MKTSTPFLTLTAFFLCFTSTLFAFEPNSFSEEDDNKSGIFTLFGGITTRNYNKARLFDYDPIENKFNLFKIVSFGILTEENTKTDTIKYFTPGGPISLLGLVEFTYDTLGRVIKVVKLESRNGQNYNVTEEKEIKYYKDTNRPSAENTYILDSYGLGLAFSERNYYDSFGNITVHVKEQYDPASEFLLNVEGDSIKYEYDDSGNVKNKYYYSFDNFLNSWKADEIWRLTFNSPNLLSSVKIDALNDDGTIKEPKYSIENILWLTETCKSHDFEKADKYDRNIWQDGQYIPFEQVENYRDNGRINVVKRWFENVFSNWIKTENTNFQTALYKLMKYHIDRVDPKYYYMNHLEYTGFDTDWNLNFGYTITLKFNELNISDEINIKSATAGDSTLILTRKIYDAGSGEWLENFKQEFDYVNTATGAEVIKLSDNITLFPNPTNGLINVGINNIKDLSQIDIINSIGQTVSSERMNNFSGNYNYSKDISYLKKGIYIIKVYSKNKVASKKFMLF